MHEENLADSLFVWGGVEHGVGENSSQDNQEWIEVLRELRGEGDT